jgi:hypothetical protein
MVRLNVSIGNYIHHNLISIVVKDCKCVILVVARFKKPETQFQNKICNEKNISTLVQLRKSCVKKIFP